MSNQHFPKQFITLAGLAGILTLAACGGGGGGGSGPASQGGFQIVDISVIDGSIWKINRPMDFVFNVDVAFSSVTLNTISIADQSGAPVTGEFSLVPEDLDGDGFKEAKRRVVFQPTCPTKDDFSDAGLKPGGLSYFIRVLGEDSGSALTVLSMAGDPLANSQTRTFTTPNSIVPAQIFLDPVIGPPTPVIHLPTSPATDPGTYLELGGDTNNRVYFEFDPSTQTFSIPSDMPLNLYSDPSSKLAVFLEINQPVNPSKENISSDRLKIEFFDQGSATWKKFDSEVELLANCTDSGATIRIRPVSILPQSPPPPAPPPPLTKMRVVITSSFEDLVGERNLLDVNNFGVLTTEPAFEEGLDPENELADELLEPFDTSANQDLSAAFVEPKAIWGGGTLKPAFDFTGDGGSDGAFDLVIPAGQVIVFDTTSTLFTGGDLGNNPETGIFSPSKQQTAVGGKLNVRHLRIDAGATLLVQGPNTVVIQATGKIIINGTLDCSGADSQDVATLNTGNQPEEGGAGNGGGGRGGTGNFLTSTSTPQGGIGNGAFNIPNTGGQGGESGFDSTASATVDKRRPGGGGGAALGADAGGAAGSGLTAKKGVNGGATATGAITGQSPPQGGAVGQRPFFDTDTTNDFFGTQFIAGVGIPDKIIPGELDQPWAGAGGGAGGNACAGPTFPTPGWTISSDEKGAGGGGGAGSLILQALDTIKFGATGKILCDGGDGASGENTNGANHVAGGSGGGSGGHVILQVGKQIDLSTASADCISARGGRFGAGSGSASTGVNAGGDGGPGIIQLHTLAGTADILLTPPATLISKTNPDPLVLVPTFGSKSRARSDWFALGGADFNPGGGFDDIKFYFEGTDTTSGLIKSTSSVVDEASAILGPSPLTAPSLVVPFNSSLNQLTLDAGSIAGTDADIYLRNTALLKHCKLRLLLGGVKKKDFDVASASYDHATQILVVIVSGLDLSTPGTPPDQFSLIRRFFRVVTNATPDVLPSSSTVKITFQGAKKKADGTPDETAILIPFTPNIDDFNVPAALGNIAFFRFDVLFDLDALNTGLSPSSPRPQIDFLRLPFRF